ncbi:uncharacterized protein LOC132934187 [Metopolophium dirhodum]|uniref:uncharacterized protein LOC132934187 n=1 Tax=Metopolophium dirhodum TaxID=44670 RepID=UPI00298FE4E8|nr:uncharacterized protein LOC132934187 [Metopolophium dirhodum]
MTIDELNALEANSEQRRVLAHTLRRNCKSFDAKRTTYQIMKTVLDNRVAEMINMEGRRGEKLAFGRLELCTLITDCVKDLFPNEQMIVFKSHISDWLKQAPKRK